MNGTDQEEIRTGEALGGGGSRRRGAQRPPPHARRAGLDPLAAFGRCRGAAARVGFTKALGMPRFYSASLKY